MSSFVRSLLSFALLICMCQTKRIKQLGEAAGNTDDAWWSGAPKQPLWWHKQAATNKNMYVWIVGTRDGVGMEDARKICNDRITCAGYGNPGRGGLQYVAVNSTIKDMVKWAKRYSQKLRPLPPASQLATGGLRMPQLPKLPWPVNKLANLSFFPKLVNRSSSSKFLTRPSEREIFGLSRIRIKHTNGSSSRRLFGRSRSAGQQSAAPSPSRFINRGKGVHIYVVDSGILAAHEMFRDLRTGRSRATQAFDAALGVNGKECSKSVNNGNSCGLDCFGHGTHVAGTAAGLHVGIATDAKVYGVKVFPLDDCGGNGNMDFHLFSGLDWIARTHQSPAVVSASLGTVSDSRTKSDLLNDGFDELVLKGLTVVVAHGNLWYDPCNLSPASAQRVITVGNVDEHDRMDWYTRNIKLRLGVNVVGENDGDPTDSKLRFSHFDKLGRCTDIYAPGHNVISGIVEPGSSRVDRYQKMSGSSMSTPHVSGVAALLLSKMQSDGQFQRLSKEALAKPPELVKRTLISNAHVVHNATPGKTVNILYTGPDATTPNR